MVDERPRIACADLLYRRQCSDKRDRSVGKRDVSAGEDERPDTRSLQSEALKNLVAVFVEDEKNRAEDMYKFLVQAGGDKFAGRIVRAMAETLYDQAHYERGIEAYRLLLKLEPMSADAYKHALAIAQAHSTMESWKALEADYTWILKEYVPPAKPSGPRSAWVSAQKPDALHASEQASEKQDEPSHHRPPKVHDGVVPASCPGADEVVLAAGCIWGRAAPVQPTSLVPL